MFKYLVVVASGCALIALAEAPHAQAPKPATQASASSPDRRATLNKYCVTCHNGRSKIGDFTLDNLDPTQVPQNADQWEKVIRKLRGGVMPPAGRPRPDRASYDALKDGLEAEIDRAALAHPNPGRPAVFHRLNRTEYRNAVRDLLALDVDVTSWLPGDPSSYGFDNIGDSLALSPSLLERYLSAAQRISKLAIGDPSIGDTVATYSVPSDLTQRDHIDGLPFGTRGGTLIHHLFPLDGEYTIQLRLGRNYNTRIVGLENKHEIEITIDGERVKLFATGGKPRRRGAPPSDEDVPGDEDDVLHVRLPVKAGTRAVGVAFLKHASVQFEDLQKPILRDAVEYSDTQGMPALARVEVGGPFGATGAEETPARKRIFVCRPKGAGDEAACAKTILSTFARRAYRRPVTGDDVQLLTQFYNDGKAAGGFEKGIESALARILVSPSFLFRIEQDPENVAPGTVYRISDLDLASRLSFFLWSSVPDDQLLDLAERGKLKEPAVFDQQVRRMLADPRSEELVTNFAGQWLHFRNVPELKPDRWHFPEFDDNLRRAFRRETELFIDSVFREDRSVLDLLTANYTFVNERLARHYGIPNIYGDHFRRITWKDETRLGLLGHGSILTLTSQPVRTSPVRRGVWILENLIGVTPPAPPPNVPSLAEDTSKAGRVLTMRERMVEHRANPVCASCHAVMDPLGLALENFDAVGKWRSVGEGNAALDVAGTMPDGTTFDGAAGLRRALVSHSTAFVTTLTEKLLTYALGRGLEYYDQPTVRAITREAAPQGYRASSLILGVVKSVPFQMRKSLDDRTTTTAGGAR